MKWEKYPIGMLCEVTSSKRIFYSEYSKQGIPFYRSKEIIEKAIGKNISDPLFISEIKYENIKRQFGAPIAKDILLTSVGTIGTAYVVKPEDKFYFKDGNLTWFRKFSDKLISKYLFYWFESSDGQSELNNSTIGSSQKALTISTLKRIQIPIPPLPIQERIADILSAYDDLIENNQKQIKLLEEAAQRLYKEWFVDFRFPGHETTPIVDGIPEGWERRKVADLIDKPLHSKEIRATEYLSSGLIPIIDQSRNFIAGYTNDEDAKLDLKKPIIVFGDHTRILKFIQFPFAKGADGTQ